jgi:hypothetical protein
LVEKVTDVVEVAAEFRASIALRSFGNDTLFIALWATSFFPNVLFGNSEFGTTLMAVKFDRHRQHPHVRK